MSTSALWLAGGALVTVAALAAAVGLAYGLYRATRSRDERDQDRN